MDAPIVETASRTVMFGRPGGDEETECRHQKAKGVVTREEG